MKVKLALSILIAFLVLIGLFGDGFAGENKWTTSGPFGGTFKSFTFDRRNPQVIFATADNGLFRSKNAGKTWERLQISGESLLVKIHPRNSGTIIAAGFSVFKSTNQGTDWERISSSAPFLSERLSDMEFDSNSAETLYALTFRAGVFKSEDGGRTWGRRSSGLDLSGCCGNPQLEVDPRNGKTVYALMRSGKVFKSTNGAQSWKSVSTGLTFGKDSPPNALAIDPNNPNVLYSGSTVTVFKTINGGAQWSALNCACQVSQIAVDPNNSQVLFVSGTQLSRTTNGGVSWQQLRVHPTLAVSTIGIGVHPDIPNLLLVGSEGGGVFRSVNDGGRFTPAAKRLTAFTTHHIVSHPQARNRIFAQGDHQLFLSTNSGQSWKVVTALSQSILRDIAIHPKNPNLIVTVGQFHDGQTVAISADAGINWKFAGPPDVAESVAVALDPLNQSTMYVGAEGRCREQVAKTTDQGKTWRQLLPSAGGCSLRPPVIAIDPKDSLTLFVGGGNFLKSIDGGLRWKTIFPRVSIGSITSITFDPRDSAIVYLTGDDGFGVLRSTNGGTKWNGDSIVTNYPDRTTGLPNCLYGSALSDYDPTAAKSCAYNFIAFDPDDPDIAYVAGDAGLFISTDRGHKWSAYDSNGLGSSAILHLLFRPSGSLFLGTDHGVFSYSRSSSPGGPVITQISPSSGKIGDAVTITGDKFGASQGSSQVLFAGAATQTVDAWSDSDIVLKVPTGAITGGASVTSSSGQSNSFQFIVLPASENKIEPASGPSSGGTRVAIISPENLSGTSFNVLFGSSLAKDVGFTGPNVITCTSPPGSGTVDVQINYAIINASVGSFTYQ